MLITDDGIPPLQWSIGQVMQLKLGHDGLARVALVRTSRGEFTRPVSKLRHLPIKRWASEYVASLQPRGKWRQERANLSVDDVVLIKDDGIPPLQWSIGRVMQLKLGHDGLARVALVRTSRGEFTRPVSNLRRLPIKNIDLHIANDECTQ